LLLLRWHIELCEPTRYGVAVGSALSIAFAMRKGEPPPACTALRGRDVAASELVCEALGLEPSAANARAVAGRQKAARRTLRRELLRAYLADAPHAVIV
jgi:hypothetical protein